MKSVKAAVLAAAVVAATIVSSSAGAQDAGGYPNKPVRIVVGFVPGSSMDAVARLMANEWSQRLKGQFVVENRPGAASAIAADIVARAPKDGYTLLTGGTVNVSTGLINTKQSFDIVRDFTPVIAVAGQPMILAVHPSLGVNSVAEFIALAKSKPGALSYGSTGIGATPHLFTELFAQRAGIKMTHVPYQGSPQAMTDLIAGRIELMFSPATAALPLIQAGKLKALAVSSAKRTAAAPQVPTLKEAGVDLDATVWFGIWAPAGTPRAVVDLLSRTGNEGLKTPEAQAILTAQGFDPIGGSPDDFAKLQADELAKWKTAVEAAGIGK